MRHFAKLGLFVAAVSAVAVANAEAPTGHVERFEFSAPLLPESTTLGRFEGDDYPTTQEAREQLVRDHTRSYDDLLVACAAYDPAIVLPTEGAPLTAEQIATNYGLVAQCAYERFSSKPYWIPQLLDDVNVCETKLGAGWRLLTEEDLALLDVTDFKYLRDTLQAAAGDDFGWAETYFGTDFYVRAADGTLQRGSFDPNATTRVTPIESAWEGQPGAGDRRTYHYEGNLGVRCIRRTVVAM